jgi:hypothetical protein
MPVREQLLNVGTNAGKIWNTLHEQGKLAKSKLIELTRLTEYEFFCGVGWLARENKIYEEIDEQYLLDKTNLTDRVGTNAGKIWKILDIWEEADLPSLERLSYLTQNEVAKALGWLACENKIWFDRNRYKLK